MKMRVILAVAVLGLGVVTITSADPQTGERPGQRAGEQTKLRASLARLRAELELQELEHEADRALLLESLKESRQVASNSGLSALVGVATTQRLYGLATSGAADASETLDKLKTPEGEKSMRTDVEKIVKDVVKTALADIDQSKRDFVKSTTELNIKRFELAEVERRYNEAK